MFVCFFCVSRNERFVVVLTSAHVSATGNRLSTPRHHLPKPPRQNLPKTSTPGSYGAGKDPMAYSKSSTKSSKVFSTHTKSSKTVDTKVQRASSAGSYEYGGYHSMPTNSQDKKSGNSKHSTESTKGTKSSKASSSKATMSVVAVTSKQSTKISKTKSAKAVGTSASDAKKPHEGSMSTGWSACFVRW
jgi:hypothetical protein